MSWTFLLKVWPLFRCSCMAAFGCSLRPDSTNVLVVSGGRDSNTVPRTNNKADPIISNHGALILTSNSGTGQKNSLPASWAVTSALACTSMPSPADGAVCRNSFTRRATMASISLGEGVHSCARMLIVERSFSNLLFVSRCMVTLLYW